MTGGNRGHRQSPTHPLCPPHSESPAWQVAFVHDGWLSMLYRCLHPCPLPVLRWLFQVRPLSPQGVPSSPATHHLFVTFFILAADDALPQHHQRCPGAVGDLAEHWG